MVEDLAACQEMSPAPRPSVTLADLLERDAHIIAVNAGLALSYVETVQQLIRLGSPDIAELARLLDRAEQHLVTVCALTRRGAASGVSKP